jgi:uncharacterized membrane protein YoaK (UPF0700 family)
MKHYQNRVVFTTTWISTLTFLAGAINVSAIFILDRTITHQTGSLSRISIAFIQQDFSLLFDFFTYVLLFFLGAFFSGFTTYKRNRGIRYLHSLYSFIFGVLLILGEINAIGKVGLLQIMAFGMGLQNGTYLRFQSITIRTTHMSGYVTDAAVSLGKAIRGNKEEGFKALFIMYSIFCFLGGGAFSAFLYIHYPDVSLLILGLLYISVSLIVFIFHPKQI